MTIARSWTMSVNFEVYAEIEGTEDYITFDATGDFEVSQDDPTYDPRSGNSLTANWRPDTYVELDEVSVAWSKETEDLGTLLHKHNITEDFNLLFSYDRDDMCDGEKDNRPQLLVSKTCSIDLLIAHSEDIKVICEGFASDMDVEPEECDEY